MEKEKELRWERIGMRGILYKEVEKRNDRYIGEIINKGNTGRK